MSRGIRTDDKFVLIWFKYSFLRVFFLLELLLHIKFEILVVSHTSFGEFRNVAEVCHRRRQLQLVLQRHPKGGTLRFPKNFYGEKVEEKKNIHAK